MGILQLIGVAVILSYPLLEKRLFNLILWVIFFFAGGVVSSIHLDHNWLLFLGLHRFDYYPLDYFPLFPWLGVVLLGVFLGNTFYAKNSRIFPVPDWDDYLPVRFLSFLGRHSLVIYVIHQPVMIGILTGALYLAGRN